MMVKTTMSAKFLPVAGFLVSFFAFFWLASLPIGSYSILWRLGFVAAAHVCDGVDHLLLGRSRCIFGARVELVSTNLHESRMAVHTSCSNRLRSRFSILAGGRVARYEQFIRWASLPAVRVSRDDRRASRRPRASSQPVSKVVTGAA